MEEGEIVPEVVDPSTVERGHLQLQELQGDCLPAGYKSMLPDRVTLNLAQNDLTGLKLIWEKLGEDGQKEFQKKYGDIALLLDQKVEEEMLKGAIYHWDPSYRCFVFGKHDMTPTIEEYQHLLMIEDSNPTKIYWPRPLNQWQKILANIVGLDPKSIWDNAEGDKMPANYLLKVAKETYKTKRGRDLLALLIYGMVVFPKKSGFVDAGVVLLFAQVQNKADPTPAIVAETVRSLGYCRKASARFEGCAQLLSIWFKSHIRKTPSKLMCFKNKGQHPILEYRKNNWPPKEDERHWKHWFGNLDEEWIIWKAIWMEHKGVPYISEQIPWIPLIGVWEVTSYSPLLVRRQYGSQQFIPLTKGMDSLNLKSKSKEDFHEVKIWVERYRNANRIDPGEFTDSVVSAYPRWHETRGKNIPKIVEARLFDSTNLEIEDVTTRMQLEIQRLKDGSEVEEWVQKCEQLEEEKQKLKVKGSQYKIDIRGLKFDVKNAEILCKGMEEQVKECHQMTEKLLKVSKRSEQRRDMMNRSAKDLKELRADNMDLEGQTWEKDNEVRRLKKEKKRMTDDMQKMIDDRAQDLERIARLEQKLEEERRRYRELEDKQEIQLEVHREATDEYRKWAENEVVEVRKRSLKEKKKLQRKAKGGKRQTKELMETLVEYRQKIKKLTQQVDDIGGDCVELSFMHEMAKQEAEEWKSKYEEAIGDCESRTDLAEEIMEP